VQTHVPEEREKKRKEKKVEIREKVGKEESRK
jgi:hypothetical protein